MNKGVLDEYKNLVSGKDFIPWTPIGTSDDDAYTGTFDGKGYTISGLYFDHPDADYYVGLFGCIGADGKISNVGVLDSYFQFGAQGGGVCGVNHGELQNCSNSSTVIGNKDKGKGGVCGDNGDINIKGTVRNCKNTGSVRGSAPLGGVCGNNYGTIKNCFNEGYVSVTVKSGGVGGVCGVNRVYGTIESCYNTGSVSGQYSVSVGGVCGYDSYYIKNCYYLSGTAAGGISKMDEIGRAAEKSIEQFKSGEVAYLLAEAKDKVFGKQVWG